MLNPEIEEIEPKFFDKIFENYGLIAEKNGKDLSCHNGLGTTIKSDKTLIKQVMTILFDNAVKYTGDDGAISIDVASSDRKLVIRVADNGSGISEEDKTKIVPRSNGWKGWLFS